MRNVLYIVTSAGCLGLAFLGLPLPSGSAGQPAPAKPEEVDRRIEQLSDGSFEVREAAAQVDGAGAGFPDSFRRLLRAKRAEGAEMRPTVSRGEKRPEISVPCKE
jgi:hypothetical protein